MEEREGKTQRERESNHFPVDCLCIALCLTSQSLFLVIDKVATIIPVGMSTIYLHVLVCT